MIEMTDFELLELCAVRAQNELLARGNTAMRVELRTILADAHEACPILRG